MNADFGHLCKPPAPSRKQREPQYCRENLLGSFRRRQKCLGPLSDVGPGRNFVLYASSRPRMGGGAEMVCERYNRVNTTLGRAFFPWGAFGPREIRPERPTVCVPSKAKAAPGASNREPAAWVRNSCRVWWKAFGIFRAKWVVGGGGGGGVGGVGGVGGGGGGVLGCVGLVGCECVGCGGFVGVCSGFGWGVFFGCFYVSCCSGRWPCVMGHNNTNPAISQPMQGHDNSETFLNRRTNRLARPPSRAEKYWGGSGHA